VFAGAARGEREIEAMRASVKWVIGAVLLVAAVLGLAASLSVFPFEREAEAEAPEPTPALEDGRYFAFVMAGEDETGSYSMGVDLAEMLTGEQARLAAVEDGVIAEGEDLPNDFYIDNPEFAYELLRVADGAVFDMISGDDTTQKVALDVDEFAALYNGTYVGFAIYGVVPLEPIAMDVTVTDGVIAHAEAVYLP
jgi:hypothetical protein